jgi:hypothetical protein
MRSRIKGFTKADVVGKKFFANFINSPGALGNPLIWILAAFGSSFRSAQMAFRKTTGISS